MNNFEERKIIATLKKHPNELSEVEQVEQLLMMRGTRLRENRFQSTREVPKSCQQSTEISCNL